MVRAVMHIQKFLNARNVRYEPYGLWDHFPNAIYGQPNAIRRRTHSNTSSSSASSSGSLLSEEQDVDTDEKEE